MDPSILPFTRSEDVTLQQLVSSAFLPLFMLPHSSMHSSPLLRLPPEILDTILSLIYKLTDIVAFALASRHCATLAIPRHTEYRLLRIRHARPEVWAHLARRADLASTIVHVHISDRQTYLQPDRVPHTLVDDLDRAHVYFNIAEETRIRNLCKGLENMRSLQSFVWQHHCSSRPTLHPEHEDYIFEVLRQSKSLERFALHGPFGYHVRSIRLDPISEGYPLWSFQNLKALSLLGDAWVKPAIAPHLLKLLQRLPLLEHLELPLEFWHLHYCRFPTLKVLKLKLLTGSSASIDATRSIFIKNHPSIEQLSWFPLGLPALTPESLPNIRRLTTTHHVVECLASIAPLPPTPSSMSFAAFQSLPPITEDPRESDSYSGMYLPSTIVSRPIECLDIRALDARTLIEYHRFFMDPSKLRKLRIYMVQHLTDLCQLGDIFPGITWLCLPTGMMQDAPLVLGKLLDALSHFPKLEVLRGRFLWDVVRNDYDKMHLAIMRLVQLLPNLKELDHLSFDEKRQAYKRIVIKRKIEVVKVAKQSSHAPKEPQTEVSLNEKQEYEEIERESVTYSIAKPVPRDVWDIFNGGFD